MKGTAEGTTACGACREQQVVACSMVVAVCEFVWVSVGRQVASVSCVKLLGGGCCLW